MAAFALSDDPNVKMIGFVLAVGVLADAFVVRMTVVPAVLALLDDRAWRLPAWLDRILPNVDIEGGALASRLDDHPVQVDPVAERDPALTR